MKFSHLAAAVICVQVGMCLSTCWRRGIECIDYTVIARSTEYEERQYPATVWISVTETGPSLSRSQIRMYRKLFRYIQGANAKEMFVNSTTPIRTKVIPCGGDGSSCNASYVMSLAIPSALYNDPPQPNNTDLFFEREPPKRYLVRGFGGRPTESEWFGEAQKLADLALKDTGVEQDHYYLNWYDPPLQLFNRLNEVWMTKSLRKRPNEQPDTQDQYSINEVC